MAWKIRRKYKRDGVCVMVGTMDEHERAVLLAGPGQPVCEVCNGEMDWYHVGPEKQWLCTVCGVEGEEFGEPDKDSPN